MPDDLLLPALVIDKCCEGWPACSCYHTSAWLSACNGVDADVFDEPSPGDGVVVDGVKSVVIDADDGVLTIVVDVDGDSSVECTTESRWRDLCLRVGATWLNGRRSRSMDIVHTMCYIVNVYDERHPMVSTISRTVHTEDNQTRNYLHIMQVVDPDGITACVHIVRITIVVNYAEPMWSNAHLAIWNRRDLTWCQVHELPYQLMTSRAIKNTQQPDQYDENYQADEDVLLSIAVAVLRRYSQNDLHAEEPRS